VLRAEPGELVAMGAALAHDGVLAYQPTLVTSSPDRLRDALATVGQATGLGDGARIIGAHLEGRFSRRFAPVPIRRRSCGNRTSTCWPPSWSPAVT